MGVMLVLVILLVLAMWHGLEARTTVNFRTRSPYYARFPLSIAIAGI
jgi:hypothetical protein